jgi:hypothetical protein
MKILCRLSFVALLGGSALAAGSGAAGIEELLRLLKSGVGEPVAREWLAQAEPEAPPTTEQLIALKAAGASDELLVDLVHKTSTVSKKHSVRRVQRVDQRTGRQILELTNQAEDGSFPPAPPAPPPKPKAEEPDEAPLAPAAIPSMLPQPMPVFFEPPVVYAEPPPAEPRHSTGTLRIIPPRGPSAFWGANPPGHHMRYFGPDGYHFPHYAEDLYGQSDTLFIFDFRIPFFQPQPFVPGPPGGFGHSTGYQSRPVGFEHR